MRLGMVGTRRAVCVDREQSVEAASYAMRLQKVDQVVVTERDVGASVPIGILSASDIVTRVVALGLDSSVVTAGDLLWSAPSRAQSSDSVAEALARLEATGANALPVVDGEGRLTGVVAAEDLLHALGGVGASRTHRSNR
ncbi:MAG TPA: CBS domain-containing protein [Burkholderiales bacterium]|nr:CBS domain-containing protein [Burkholderiales bacterium]